MRDFAAMEWKRARAALAAAEAVVGIDPNSAASRAYYAAFHAVRALFALRGQTFSKHTAVRAAVHRDLVHSGLWGDDLGLAYEFLLDLRETGDYGGHEDVSQSDAATATEKAAMILDAVKNTYPEITNFEV